MRSSQRFTASHLSALLALSSAGSIPNIAQAQLVLEEVVVTARKREESLQETPVAVSAFSGDALQELGINDIVRLTKVVPNVDMNPGNGTSGTANVFIRGVGARNQGVNFDSGVGIYVDGVYVSRADGAIMDNVDVQNLQVLRGPQGTLFGKNTTGGAILYTTNRPNEEFGGYAEVRVGNYNKLDGKLTVNIPLAGDTLLSRFSLYKTKNDGYVHSVVPDNLPTQAEGNLPFLVDDFNDTDRRGGQAQIRWLPSQDVLLDLNYSYGKTDQKARGQNCEVVTNVPGAGWQAELQNGAIVVPSTGQTIDEWCQTNQDLGRDKIMADLVPNRYRAEVKTLSLTAEWDISDTLNFKSITAWRNTVGGEANEVDAIGISLLARSDFLSQGDARDTDAYSQEFQFSGSAFDDQLDYVAGVYGIHEESDRGAYTAPSGPSFNTLFQPNTAFYLNNRTELLAENASASLFGQADWHFDDHWTLTLGARYTWEERKLTRNYSTPELSTLATTGDATYFPIPGSFDFITFPSGPDTFNINHTYTTINPATGLEDPLAHQKGDYEKSKFTPMASIQRTFDEFGIMNFGNMYFTIANGFLSGGVTDTVSLTTGRIGEYDPEEVWNYELGFKMDAWDRKLRLNTALFYTDYQDRQLTTVRISTDGRIVPALINAESSYISGIELEAIVLPVDNLQITANVTFNRSDIEEFDDDLITAYTPGTEVPAGCEPITISGAGEVLNCAIDRSDENLPRLPDSVYYLAAQYSFDTGYGTVVPMIAWSYRKNLDNCFDASSCKSGLYKVDQEDFSARLTWHAPDMDWRVTAYGNNLTNERYITGGTPIVDLTSTAGTIYNHPRTYGVEASYTW